MTEEDLFLLSSERDRRVQVDLSSIHDLSIKDEIFSRVIIVECAEETDAVSVSVLSSKSFSHSHLLGS